MGMRAVLPCVGGDRPGIREEPVTFGLGLTLVSIAQVKSVKTPKYSEKKNW